MAVSPSALKTTCVATCKTIDVAVVGRHVQSNIIATCASMAPSAASTRPCTTPAASPALLIDTSILYSVVNHTSARAEPVARAAMPQPAADMAGNESVVRGSLHVHGHESIHPSIIGNTSRCRKKRIRHTPPISPRINASNQPSKQTQHKERTPLAARAPERQAWFRRAESQVDELQMSSSPPCASQLPTFSPAAPKRS